jgi:prolyl-tRNA synthetase
MRLSQLFTETKKDTPSDEVSKNAQLLIRAGFIHKEMAGVYDYLPLGLKVIEKVKRIVREEMDAIGGNELLMSSLQRPEVWQKTERWDESKVDIWFKTRLQSGQEAGLGWSHEEPISDMMRSHIMSYKDLPAYVYQFQSKLRNELRAKSGIMRGREFIMKDMYSFSRDDKSHQEFYQKATEAYHRVFERLELGDITFFTLADGKPFTQFSHEFQTLCEAGEDIIYLDRQKKLAVNKEIMRDDILKEQGLKREELEEVRAAEVGNIFSFGTQKSEQLGLNFTDEDGSTKPVTLGSYGIGITRLVGVITELMSDDKGLVWPAGIAPASVHLVRIGDGDEAAKAADDLYNKLESAGIETLYDDRGLNAGVMLADADLIGVPHRAVVSDKSLAGGGVEYKVRTSSETEVLSAEEFVKKITT